MSFRWTTWGKGVGGGAGVALGPLGFFRRLKGNLFSTLLVPVGRERGIGAGIVTRWDTGTLR